MRPEVSSSNPGLRKCAYFVKKLYLDSEGVCGGGRLVGIFFLFYFIIFEFLLIF
jgi:hypothetical protein